MNKYYKVGRYIILQSNDRWIIYSSVGNTIGYNSSKEKAIRLAVGWMRYVTETD